MSWSFHRTSFIPWSQSSMLDSRFFNPQHKVWLYKDKSFSYKDENVIYWQARLYLCSCRSGLISSWSQSKSCYGLYTVQYHINMLTRCFADINDSTPNLTISTRRPIRRLMLVFYLFRRSWLWYIMSNKWSGGVLVSVCIMTRLVNSHSEDSFKELLTPALLCLIGPFPA